MTVHLNDLISREEAIRLIMDKAMKENGKKYEHLNDRAYYRYLHGECCYRNAARLIEKMPAAAGSVKHGKWISTVQGIKDHLEHCRCDQCESVQIFYGRKPTNYCPDCGAKMDGVIREGEKNE